MLAILVSLYVGNIATANKFFRSAICRPLVVFLGHSECRSLPPGKRPSSRNVRLPPIPGTQRSAQSASPSPATMCTVRALLEFICEEESLAQTCARIGGDHA